MVVRPDGACFPFYYGGLLRWVCILTSGRQDNSRLAFLAVPGSTYETGPRFVPLGTDFTGQKVELDETAAGIRWDKFHFAANRSARFVSALVALIRADSG